MDEGDEAYGASWSVWRPKAAAYARAFGIACAEERFEIADEAIARAYAARGRFDQSRDFSPWFFVIVRRLCLDALKRRRELPLIPERLDEEPARTASVEGESMADEKDLRKAAEFFMSMKAWIALAASIGVMIGLISILALYDPERESAKLGVNLAVMLLSVMQALLFIALVPYPLGSIARRRLSAAA